MARLSLGILVVGALAVGGAQLIGKKEPPRHRIPTAAPATFLELPKAPPPPGPPVAVATLPAGPVMTAPATTPVVLRVRSARVRGGPSLSAMQVTSLAQGTSAGVVARDGDWVQLRMPDGSVVGWTHRTNVTGPEEASAPRTVGAASTAARAAAVPRAASDTQVRQLIVLQSRATYPYPSGRGRGTSG